MLAYTISLLGRGRASFVGLGVESPIGWVINRTPKNKLAVNGNYHLVFHGSACDSTEQGSGIAVSDLRKGSLEARKGKARE